MFRAKKGGEYGANGKFYLGGQFAADSKDKNPEWSQRKKSPKQYKETRKYQIEPFKWVEGKRWETTIYEHIKEWIDIWQWRKDGEMKFHECAEYAIRYNCRCTGHSCSEHDADMVVKINLELIRLYNEGKRVMTWQEMFDFCEKYTGRHHELLDWQKMPELELN